MRGACVLAVLFATAFATGADDERLLKVTSQRGLPAFESVTVYRTKDGKRETVGELTKFDKPLVLPSDGPYEVWAKPKGGMAVKVLDKLTVATGKTHELKLGEVLGVIEVFGDNFPRA